MKSAVILFIFIALVFGSAAHAQTTTSGVKVTALSLTDDGGGLLIQTTPRHNLDSGCTQDFWIVLQNSPANTNHDVLVSMLLTAQSRGSNVAVTAVGVGNDFCNLQRLVLEE